MNNKIIVCIFALLTGVSSCKKDSNTIQDQPSPTECGDEMSSSTGVEITSGTGIAPEEQHKITWLTYDEGVKISKLSNRNMMILYSAEWCGYCEDLNNLLETELINKIIVDENYVTIKVDFDRERELSKDATITVVPTIRIVSPENILLRKIVGYEPHVDFWTKNLKLNRSIFRFIVGN